ncbi:MAG: hypothetical protein GX284_02385 [Clostridiales bacterium]|uniref:hypothetical protein n=1 Tax=Roseburia sp. MSJ-14 TaxID=2841514 RepID=UPI00168DBF9A|nr:hypothetical protein [Roseburia sp. MSJ-14]MBU5474593.1 hypothetical protein [Roseburia sp. MSJ-14]NLK76565.1 hypothetical protein [Clostridiales bacterium]
MNLKNSRFEWVCKTSESALQKFVRIFAQWGCIIFGILTMVFMYYIPFLIITVICAIGWFVLFRNRKTEYEFDYFSEDLTIFKISNAIRRKKKFACHLDNIDYIVKGINNQNPTKKFYFDPENVYSMQVSNSEGKQTLLIEADERFLQILDQEHKLRK